MNLFFNYENIYIKELMLIFWISIIGVFFLFMSNEFFIIYLALELQNLILYILTSLRRWRSKSIESSMKYYIMGSFSSGLLLYGIVMLFGYFGTLDFIEISYLIKDILVLEIEIYYIIYMSFFILIGLLFKLGVAPFHWWVPEIYEGAPVIITLFFSIIPKFSLIVILYKFYIYILIYLNFFFNDFFFFLSILSLLIGFIFSLYQKKIIKLLAYSSIFNSGFFLACFSNGTYLSLISVFYFFIPYMFLLLGIFFILIVFRKIKNEKMNLLWDFSLLANSNLILALIIAILFFSLAGIPPLSGFFGKFFILLSIYLNKFYILFFILMIFSIFSSFYYFRVIRFLFFSNKLDYIFIKPNLSSLLLVIYFLISIFFFLFFDYIFLFFFNILLNFTSFQ
jgi:NADH-quinone oxidoreductase subunit N